MTYQQMKLDSKRLQLFESPLVSFSEGQVYPKGIISLSIMVSSYPMQVTKQVDFLVFNYPSIYNIILGRPTLNRLKAATSTYCLKVKIQTPSRIGEISGGQPLASECHNAVLASKENHPWMIEEESETTVEESKLAKETFNVELVEGDSSKVRKIGRELQSPLKEEIINFLKGNLDIFSRSYKDMYSINRRVIKHCLNVSPTKRPSQQKRRIFAPERNKAVMEEVDKLLQNGLQNIIVVKRKEKNPMENGGCAWVSKNQTVHVLWIAFLSRGLISSSIS